ncbi:lysoplasmalogenase [Nocardia sp. SYP-A9097]|uniref:lysoplasmalogenase n=1 Tax=Nocardia sp. SYP-A9097 TaxID=2663237 RepID=UPI00129B41A0|nr:lysoplasmalogenase [Nocardia sp. SYP-A9097]MRH93140.1 lysoplasmalogenase [Nocardia sp. SYP-A9097]
MPRPFRAAFVGAAAVTVFGAVTGRDKLQWAAKPFMMPLLAADVALNDDGLESADRTVLLGALAAATVGDILLIEPDNDRRLIAGASSFAVMQTGYSWLWWRRGGRPQPAIAGQRLVAWLGAAVLMRAKAPAVALPLTVYGATLGTAATLASDPGIAPGAKNIAGLNIPGSDPRSRLGLGALLFTVSDGLIVLRKIFARSDRSRRVTEGFILGTYAAAQYLLADPRAHR